MIEASSCSRIRSLPVQHKGDILSCHPCALGQPAGKVILDLRSAPNWLEFKHLNGIVKSFLSRSWCPGYLGNPNRPGSWCKVFSAGP
jgi:hypothetical protein